MSIVGPGIPSKDPVDPAATAVLLSHADRSWKAEEVNATRLATRANLVLSGVSAAIGVFIFALSKSSLVVLDVPFGTKSLFFIGLALLSVFFLGWALLGVLGVRRDKASQDQQGELDDAPTASDWLAFTTEELERLNSVTHAEALVLAFRKTYDAFTDLQERNARRKNAIDRAQRRLIWGLSAILLTIGLYVWIEYDRRQASIEHAAQHANNRPQQPPSGQRGDTTP